MRRVWSPVHFHHVTSRGNWRDDLFRKERDFRYFLNLIDKSYKKYGIELASYCLMSNHYHLLLKSEETHLSTVMRWINKSYADYYNYRYDVSGHLFQKRFYSKPIYDVFGVAEVGRYIHLNPVDACIVRQPQEYRWSSYRYLHRPGSPLPAYLNLNPLFEHFPGQTSAQKIKIYTSWTQERAKLIL